MPARDLQKTFEASVFGMIRVTQRLLPVFRRQGSGMVVNVLSVMGRKAVACFGSDAMAMSAVSAFSDALRQELAHQYIGVSVIHPALTASG